MRHRAQVRRRLGRVAARSGISVLVALAAAGGVMAYMTSTGTGTASGGVAALTAPTITSATPGAGTVALVWSAVTAPGPGTVSYYVSRDGGAPEGGCPSAASPSAATSCTNTGVALGTHSYTVTAVWRSWTVTSPSESAQVTFGPATHFGLTTTNTAPEAGAGASLTVTAQDEDDNTVATYTGSHNLTFSGASTIGSFHPTVTNSSGTVKNFGSATALLFTAGVASVAGSSNGRMTLYAAETANVAIVAGTLHTAAPLSVSVSSLAAVSLSLVAATSSPTAGAADNLTITAKDTYGNPASSYTGSHSLTFSGASAIGSFTPNVTDSAGTATSFGVATAILFTSGVASVSGASNGTMTLYKAETASVKVTDGSLSNGSGVSIVVARGAAANFTLTASTITPTAAAADNLTTTAKDPYGNTATSYTGSHSLTFSGASDSPNGTHATVTNSSGTATSFGAATAINFTNGVASVSSGSNGAMKLYKSGAASIAVSDGSIGNAIALSVTVTPAAAASFVVTPATSTPTVGEADGLTVAAFDTYGNAATTYTGSHSLTFSGASNSPNVTHPTVTNSAGAAKNFGVATALVFTSGVASASGASNGVMKLYKAETASITATAGTVSNGGGLSVTTATGAPAALAWTHVTASAGTLSAPCLFTCTATTLGSLGTWTANVSVTDSAGNTVSDLGAGYTVTVSTPTSGAGSGGSFTAPSAGTSVTLAIADSGVADSTAQLTFGTQGGSGWTSDTMTAQTLTGASYTNATATLKRT